MASSGQYVYSVTRNEIIEDAAELAGILDPEGGQLTPFQYARMTRILNTMVKSWEADGLQIWLRKIFTVFLTVDQSSYSISLTGDHATRTYVETTVASGSGTSIVVASGTGISTGDYIGVEQSDNSMVWTTITNKSGTTLTLNATVGSPSVGAIVYTYTTKVPRPIRILDGYIRQSASDSDTPVKLLSQEEYNRFGAKTTSGLTTQVFYHATIPSGTLYVYPVPTDATNLLFLEGMYQFQDFITYDDTADFPAEWHNAIIYNLAVEFGFRYGLDEQRLKILKMEADKLKWTAMGTSQENSVYMVPDTVMMR